MTGFQGGRGVGSPGIAVRARDRLCGADDGADDGAGRGQEGAGSVLVLTGFSVLLVVGMVAVALVAAQGLHTRAASAADLAALAAASAALSGSEVACARAADVAVANEARLEACRLSATDAWVEVSAPTPQSIRRLLRAPSEARARAHAELVVAEERG